MTVMTPVSPTAQPAIEPDPLKGGDVYGWAMDQAELIRAGRYDEVDIVNVADEIESVGNSQFQSLVSNLAVVLAHMLKRDHQPGRRSRSWFVSIVEHRARITDDLADNPSLKPRIDEAVGRGYRSGRASAFDETGLPLKQFPESCSYDWDAIMTRPFVLEERDAP